MEHPTHVTKQMPNMTATIENQLPNMPQVPTESLSSKEDLLLAQTSDRTFASGDHARLPMTRMSSHGRNIPTTHDYSRIFLIGKSLVH